MILFRKQYFINNDNYSKLYLMKVWYISVIELHHLKLLIVVSISNLIRTLFTLKHFLW